jgi:Ca2+-binding EF-hand superfamily protein
MTSIAGFLGLFLAVAPAPGDDSQVSAPPAAAFASLGDDAVHDLIILGDTRPIILRVRVMVGDRSLKAAWDEAMRALHGQLDRDGDGRVTIEEADKSGLAIVLGPAAPGGAARNAAALDTNPKDGAISTEELAEALRANAGPFKLQVEGSSERKTDALFDQLDRDKDGQLTRTEMEAIVGSLRGLDRDANELIDVEEINLNTASESAPMMAMERRPTRDSSVPAVLELAPGESPVRLARLLIKQYDTGSSRGPGKRDSKVSPEEFAIAPSAFKAADKSGDGLLNAEEVRSYLADAPRDAFLDVALSADASGHAVATVRGADGDVPPGMSIRQLAERVVEIDLGLIRLDIHVDDGAGTTETTRKTFQTLFEAADANQDGYLEESELTNDNGQVSPYSGLFKAMDRDGDKKLYPREIDDFIAKQAVAARGRVVLNASNEGRALFGMLDIDRDRRLGAREVLDTFARVSACDRDKDGRVTPDEIPHHIQLSLTRGDLSSLLAPPAGNPAVAVVARAMTMGPAPRPAAGPAWFRKMDRNHDGDVSPREFLGTREQFDRLDRDHDGLLAPAEADAATAARAK